MLLSYINDAAIHFPSATIEADLMFSSQMEANGLLHSPCLNPTRAHTQRSEWLFLLQFLSRQFRPGQWTTPRGRIPLRATEAHSHGRPIPRPLLRSLYQKTKRVPTDQALSFRARSYPRLTQRMAIMPATVQLKRQIRSTNTFL